MPFFWVEQVVLLSEQVDDALKRRLRNEHETDLVLVLAHDRCTENVSGPPLLAELALHLGEPARVVVFIFRDELDLGLPRLREVDRAHDATGLQLVKELLPVALS